MGTIFWSSARNICLAGGRYFLIGLAVGMLAGKLVFSEISYFTCFFSGMALLQASIETGRRLPFLLSLPFSRGKMIFLVGSINFFAVGVFATLMTMHFALISYLFVPASTISKASTVVAGADLTEGSPLFLFAAFQIGVSACLWGFFMAIDPFAMKRTAPSRIPPMGASWSWKEFRGAALTAVLLTTMGVLIFRSVFLLCGAVLAGLTLWCLEVVAKAWVFTPARKRRWAACFVVFVGFQVGSLFLVSRWQLHSERTAEKVSAARFLGFLGPRLDTAFLRAAISKPMKEADAASLAEMIREHAGKEKFPLSTQFPLFSAAELVRAQPDPDVLRQLIPLFSVASISANDLDAILGVQSLKGPASLLPNEDGLITIPIPGPLVARWLAQGGPRERFALRYAQFHPNAAFLAPIAQGLRKTYLAERIPSALLALSILEENKFDLRSFLDRTVGEGAALDDDCKEATFEALGASKHEGHFNRCVRVKAAASLRHPELVARLGTWKKLPLDPVDAAALQRADSLDQLR